MQLGDVRCIIRFPVRSQFLVLLILQPLELIAGLITVLHGQDEFHEAVLVEEHRCTSDQVDNVLEITSIKCIFNTSDGYDDIEIKFELIDAFDELHEDIGVVLLVEIFALFLRIQGVAVQLLYQPSEFV